MYPLTLTDFRNVIIYIKSFLVLTRNERKRKMTLCLYYMLSRAQEEKKTKFRVFFS